jgi:hypothetical protein
MRDKTGTVYVVSVSGGKMYKLRPDAWDGWEAERDRAAENTQLFQIITIEDNTLTFESYTAIGELYDAFDLIKKGPDQPNSFIERKQEAIAERTFPNTIPYEDKLPEELKQMMLNIYKGYEFDKVTYIRNGSFLGYRVQLEKGDEEVTLYIDEKGNILKELVEKD